MFSDPRLFIGGLFALVGGIFLAAGLGVVSMSYDASWGLLR